MSWVQAEGPDNHEMFVRASDIAEIELSGDGRALFRRRGNPFQYVVKEPSAIARLEDMLTSAETAPTPAIFPGVPVAAPAVPAVPPPPKPQPQPPPKPKENPARRVLALLESGPQWRPQLRQSLIASGMSLVTAQAAIGVAVRFKYVDSSSDLLVLTSAGRQQLAQLRTHGEMA